VGRRELRVGRLVGEVLQHRRRFREHFAAIELERRHIAFRIDGEEVLAARRLPGLEVNRLGLEPHARLLEDDVGRERAGARCVEKFHAISPCSAL
jgi:hypothetical protein